MKNKILTLLCLSALVACTLESARADDQSAAAAADAIVVRPVGLAATVIGSVIFVFALPFTAAGGHIKDSAHTLIGVPAKATFNRRLGDFSTLQYSE